MVLNKGYRWGNNLININPTQNFKNDTALYKITEYQHTSKFEEF